MSRDPSSCRERRRPFGRAGIAGLVVAVLATLAAALPAAAAPRYPSKPPASIAGLDFSDMKDYEPEHPGLGRAYGYGVAVANLDVYLYALGLEGPPSRADLVAAMEQSSADIALVAETGRYRDLRVLESFALTAKGKTAQCRHFSFVLDGVGATSSYLCIAASYGQFLKIRLTLERSVESELPGKTVLKAALAAFSG